MNFERSLMKAGLYTALVTPFTPDGNDVQWELFDELVKRQLEAGVSGLVIFGTTGESATVTRDERKKLVRRAVDKVKGRCKVVAGCGTNSTKTTIEQAQDALDSGADAIQVVSPSYNKPTQEGLYLHIKAIHDAVPIPMCLYNIPGRTAVNIDTKTFTEIAKLKRVIGMKESSGTMQQLMDIIEETPHMSVFSGDDILFLPSFALGAKGLTSVLSNLIPNTMQKLVTLALSNNISEARQLFYKIKPLIQACFFETNPAPIKFLLESIGIPVGPCRLPLAPLQPKNKDLILKALNTYHETKLGF